MQDDAWTLAAERLCYDEVCRIAAALMAARPKKLTVSQAMREAWRIYNNRE